MVYHVPLRLLGLLSIQERLPNATESAQPPTPKKKSSHVLYNATDPFVRPQRLPLLHMSQDPYVHGVSVTVRQTDRQRQAVPSVSARSADKTGRRDCGTAGH